MIFSTPLPIPKKYDTTRNNQALVLLPLLPVYDGPLHGATNATLTSALYHQVDIALSPERQHTHAKKKLSYTTACLIPIFISFSATTATHT